MGAGRWDHTSRSAYASFTASTATKSTDEIYSERKLNPNLDPFGVNRESRDSAENPNSTAIIVGIDVTGSMGMIADVLARKGLDTLFTSLLDAKPVSDPHLMFMAIGDANYDRAPLQVSQFEADARIIEQLTQIYVEKGGGGNSFESYNLPWWFAAQHTSIDCFEKRGNKGYLFTVGDEEAPQPLTSAQLQKVCGDSVQRELSTKELLALVQQKYHVFHIVIEEGNHARAYPARVRSSWNELLGQHVIFLPDHTKLAEVIVTAIALNEGQMHEWTDPATARIVHEATQNLRLPPPAAS